MIPTQSGRPYYAGLLEALVQIMGSAQGYLMDHGPRVALLSARLGYRMGLCERDVSRLFFASILADMGMVGIAEQAWEDAAPALSPDVRARVERHPIRSEERIRGVPHLAELAPLVRHHHEWWDGSGYPDGLRGEEIPLGAQILRIADTVTALGRPRPHRGALGRAAIIEVVRRSMGVEFGPMVARTWLALSMAEEIPGYEPTAFRYAVVQASESLLPEEVSPLSSDQLLAILAALIDAKDPYTAGHSRRVALLGVEVASQLGMEDRLAETLWAGGYLHDLGKLRVPLRILAKPGRLTREELASVERHPSDGARILEGIPTLRHLTTSARYHHERWDGSGYPEGLTGNHIPLVAQILAVSDAYDAMTSRRAYRTSRTHEAAVAEIRASSGTHFSPAVAEAFLAIDEGVFPAIRTSEARVGTAGRPGRGPLRAAWRRRGTRRAAGG